MFNRAPTFEIKIIQKLKANIEGSKIDLKLIKIILKS